MKRILCFLAGLCVTAHSQYGKPNIILMMADDMGWGDTHYNGNPIILTPNLDSMAAVSVNFRHFHSQSAVCSPTRGSVLTGRHPDRYGVNTANDGRMEPGELTLAEVLKTQGYRTGHFGKWHLGVLTTEINDANRGGPGREAIYSPPWVNGFDSCLSTESKVPTWDPMKDPDHPGQAYGTHYWNCHGDTVSENVEGDDSKIIMDRVIPFIRRAHADGVPFFAVVWFHGPHLPIVAGEPYISLYDNVSASANKKTYMAVITALDNQVGRLRRELKTLGLDNTFLAFTSDNGPESAGDNPGQTGGLRGRKHSYYEGGTRVPGLVEWPAVIKAGKVTDYLAVSTDYYPTLLNILNLEIVSGQPLPIDGTSFLNVLLGKATVRTQPLAFAAGGWKALIAGDKKAVQQGTGSWQLYDLASDSSESVDLAGKAGRKGLLDSMKTVYAAWYGGLAKEKNYPKEPLSVVSHATAIGSGRDAVRNLLPAPAFDGVYNVQGRNLEEMARRSGGVLSRQGAGTFLIRKRTEH